MSASAVKSARRVIEILEHFDRVRRPLGLKEICDHLRYPVSSGAMVLKSLVVLGYLAYDRASRTYMPTMRIAVLGDWVPETLFGDADILPAMARLRDRTRETVILGAQSDLFAHYVHAAHSMEPLHYVVSPGAVRPLGRCGIGRMLLSALPDREIDRLVRRINIAEPDHRLDLGELMDDLQGIRRQGYVFSKSLYTEGVGVIAVLLPFAPFGRRFALGIAGPVTRLEAQAQEHLDSLRAAVDAVGVGASRKPQEQVRETA